MPTSRTTRLGVRLANQVRQGDYWRALAWKFQCAPAGLQPQVVETARLGEHIHGAQAGDKTHKRNTEPLLPRRIAQQAERNTHLCAPAPFGTLRRRLPVATPAHIQRRAHRHFQTLRAQRIHNKLIRRQSLPLRVYGENHAVIVFHIAVAPNLLGTNGTGFRVVAHEGNIDCVRSIAQKRARRELSRPTLPRVIKRVDTQGFCPFRLVHDPVNNGRLCKPLRGNRCRLHRLRSNKRD